MPTPVALLALLPAIAPNPIDEGTLRPGLDPSQVTPGLVGFLMSLLLAVAVILLVLDFNRRNRRLRYRAEYAERRAAAERAGGPADGGAARPDGTPGAAGPAGTGAGEPHAGEPGAAEPGPTGTGERDRPR